MKPHLQSLILASHIFQDKGSNNFVIAGTFNRLHFRQNLPESTQVEGEQPSKLHRKSINQLRAMGSPWLFFSVTDIVGKVDCSIRYVYLKDNQVLFSTNFVIESSDGLATLEHKLPLPVLPIVGEGQYAIEFLARNEMIGSLRVMAVPEEIETKDAGT